MKKKIGVSLIWCNKSWRNINLADAKIWRILLRQIMLTRVSGKMLIHIYIDPLSEPPPPKKVKNKVFP